MMVDTSELEGRSFSCVNGCAMCCLCQPELTEDELKIFETDEYLRAGLTREHIDGRRTARPTAIKLQGRWGACHFLKNRRCSINEIKPHFCRQFPVHIHLLRRPQMNVNLSCRGVTNNGNSLKSHAKTLLSSLPEERIASQLSVARKVAHEFDLRCQKSGVYQPPERLRSVAAKLLPLIGTEEGVGKLLAFAHQEPGLGGVSEERIVDLVARTSPAADLEVMASESNYEQFDLDDLAKLPVYVDDHLMWNIFQSNDGRINCMVLDEAGTLELRKSLELGEIGLLPRDAEALRISADYARVLINRDPLIGNAAFICDMHDYEHDLMIVYLGVLGTSLLDLWWRTSLLGSMYEQEVIDGWLASEGIRSFDMDFLDAPTIGSYI